MCVEYLQYIFSKNIIGAPKVRDYFWCTTMLLYRYHFQNIFFARKINDKKMKKKQDSCNLVFTTLPHSLTLLHNLFYLALLSHNLLHPKNLDTYTLITDISIACSKYDYGAEICF